MKFNQLKLLVLLFASSASSIFSSMRTISLSNYYRSFSCTQDGRYLLGKSLTGKNGFIDTKTGECQEINLNLDYFSTEISPDGKHFVAVTSEDKVIPKEFYVHIFKIVGSSVSDWQLIKIFTIDTFPHTKRFFHDSSRFCIGSTTGEDAQIYEYDTTTWELLRCFNPQVQKTDIRVRLNYYESDRKVSPNGRYRADVTFKNDFFTSKLKTYNKPQCTVTIKIVDLRTKKTVKKVQLRVRRDAREMKIRSQSLCRFTVDNKTLIFAYHNRVWVIDINDQNSGQVKKIRRKF